MLTTCWSGPIRMEFNPAGRGDRDMRSEEAQEQRTAAWEVPFAAVNKAKTTL